ncbi:hypothetical protein [Sutcliffiella deserti]|uniref:hypothetical protein n=1 Tax=Sutcliffiella deserti TaxID=2875501 RepID=UPI001CBB5F4E|nr:hypothetical protein [Sutcliffiella deserti]
MDIVNQQCVKLRQLFHQIEGCSVEETNRKDNGLLIKSNRPVPWKDSLKPQRGESKYKIGYIFPKKKGLGLYIDFPKGYFEQENIKPVINPEQKLKYFNQGETAKGSWWRFRSDEFDSIHMVLHNEILSTYDFERPELQTLFEQIVAASYSTGN